MRRSLNCQTIIIFSNYKKKFEFTVYIMYNKKQEISHRNKE